MGLGPQKHISYLLSFREFLQTWLIPGGTLGNSPSTRLDTDPELRSGIRDTRGSLGHLPWQWPAQPPHLTHTLPGGLGVSLVPSAHPCW